MFFDTHAHYDDDAYDPDRDTLLNALPSQGISFVLNPGCSVERSQAAVALAEKYPHVYAAVGIHPSECGGLEISSTIEALKFLTSHPKVKAVGEIGLDYYWEDNPPKDIQKAIFRAQMDLAKQTNLPVIIHDREAHQDTLEVVQDYDLRGVYHCYSGGVDYAKILVNKGWMISFTGVVTYKDAKKALEVVKAIPIEHLMLETDAPYLTPVPHRGKRNESSYLPHIAQVIADLKGISLEECANITTENAKKFFAI